MNNPYYTFPEKQGEAEPSAPQAPHPGEIRRHFSKLGTAYLAMTAAYLTAAYALAFTVALLKPEIYQAWWFSWASSLIPLYAVGLPVLLYFLRRIPASPHNIDCCVYGQTMEKSPFGVRQFLILLVIAFGCMTAGGLLGNLIMGALSELMQYDYAFALNSMVMDTPTWFTFICACICAPLGEELLFRKLLIDRVRRFGDLPAILLSGLLFGLFHGNLFQLFYATVVGMLLAYVYTRSGRYSLCVIMHAIINSVGSVISPAVAKLVQAGMPSDTPDYENMTALLADSGFVLALLAGLLLVIWEFGMLAAGISLFCVRFKHRKLSRGEVPLVGEYSSSLTLCNPGMAVCVAIMLLLVVVNLIPAG